MRWQTRSASFWLLAVTLGCLYNSPFLRVQNTPHFRFAAERFAANSL
jgi:hypothetical protein